MQCSYCPQSLLISRFSKRPEGNLRKMTFETFKTCLDKVPSYVEILFAGMAEPWLNPSCTRMLLYAYEKGHPMAVYTTCSGMTLADLDQFKDVPFIHFCIHLPDAFGQMRMQITTEYVEVVRSCRRLIHNTNFVVYGPLHPLMAKALGHDVPDSSLGLISRAGNLPDRTIPRKEGPLHCPACGPELNHNILMPNGDVALCCMDYGLDHLLGNLVHQDYEALFKSEAYQKVMRGLKDGTVDTKCRHCEISRPD